MDSVDHRIYLDEERYRALEPFDQDDGVNELPGEVYHGGPIRHCVTANSDPPSAMSMPTCRLRSGRRCISISYGVKTANGWAKIRTVTTLQTATFDIDNWHLMSRRSG